MKLRSTTPASGFSRAMRISVVSLVALVTVAVPVQFFSSGSVSADTYDAKITALRKKVASYESEANELRKKANTLQNTLGQLSADKAKIQTEINLHQVTYDQLVKEIKDTQIKIDENKRVSGDLIVKSSLSEDIPLIVRFAASDNLADYIDGEVSRISVRDTIVQKTEENEKLKIQLEEKRVEVKRVLDAQKLKRNELASKEATQQRLIAETNNNESKYQDMIKSNQDQIKQFQKAQNELRRLRQQGAGGGRYVTSGSSTGGYPWDHIKGCYSDACADPWRLFYSECTSYVAWRLDNQGYGVQSFDGRGHAYQWPETTGGWQGVRQSTSPRKGDAAVFPAYVNGAAWTGHVMYVEEVYGNGTILVSEYNWDGEGSFSKRELASYEYGGTTFISFPRK